LRDIRAARKVGVSAYIIKPPDPDDLRAVVDAAAIASASQRTRRAAAGSPPVRARHLALVDLPPERHEAVDPEAIVALLGQPDGGPRNWPVRLICGSVRTPCGFEP
jgi:hypothetical protein